MDLKTFGEDDFDPKKWINKAWSSSGNQEKDVFVNNTVTRLQLYMKQLTNSLDETTTQIVTSIPRVLQDASSLQLDGALLQQRLLSLEQMVRDVQEQTGHSIESLQRTDQLKSRLENAASTLREADKWAALAAWLEDVLEAGVPTGSNELQELAGRVAAMTASLEVLSEAPDYESKRLQLETLYNRLEAAITPPFIEALTQMDAERTSVYVSLLTGMSRGAPARRCWRRAAAARLAAGWRRLDAHSSPALTHLLAADANKQTLVSLSLPLSLSFSLSLSAPPARVLVPLPGVSRRPGPALLARAAAARLAAGWRRLDAHSSPALTHLLAADANKQVEWLTNVLKADTPLGELIRLYTDLLLSLEPPPTKVASASFKLCSTPEEGINLLTDLRRDIDEFITFIRNVIDAPRPNKEILLPATLREFGRAAYAPLRELLPFYTELQGRMLLEKLSDPQLQQEDLLEQSRALLSIAERCDDWLATAYSKAKKIAGIAVYPYYLPAVDNFFTALSNLISSHSRTIETSFLESAGRGRGSGVLCAAFPAALALEAAAAAALSAAAAGHARESKDEEPSEPHILEDLPALLLDSGPRAKLSSLRAEAYPSLAALRRTKDQLRALARAVLRRPVEAQLDKIPQLPVWNNNDALSTDLPDFALSPQEYITEIGQYLMTLPQHLEMHLSEKQAPWQFLSEVCTHTCEVYAEKILNIRNMDALGTKRCLTDIAYLSSVVEDLGSSITPALKNLEKSLRAAAPSQAE